MLREMTDEEVRKRISIVKDDDGDKENPVCYFCQVYADKEQDIELDYFCIRRNDVSSIDDFEQVEQFAIDNVKDCLQQWINDYR